MSNLFKLDPTRSIVGTMGESGTGVGLIIVKEMVAMNGGEISVNSVEGEGTIVSFTVRKVANGKS